MIGIQTENQPTSKQKRALFFYLCLLTLLFVFLQISCLFNLSGFYLGDIEGMTRHLDIPYGVMPSVLFFIVVQCVIHFLFVLLIWIEALCIRLALNLTWRQLEKAAFLLWGVSIVTAIFGNQYYFPNAKFATWTAFAISHAAAGALFYIGFSILTIASVIAILGCIKAFPKIMIIAMSLLCAGVPAYQFFHKPSVSVIVDAATIQKPNIIIIGIDSLRPDFLGYFGHEPHTPYLDAFLNHSTVFAEAMTPIARTFPSWVSILTGKYPKQSNARTNLQDIHEIVGLDKTLPNVLRKQGYTTMFATDETRFSNIDSNYGFDSTVTPPIGVNDFLLGTINDFPFSNALVNTVLGQWLFPNSYGSRPVASTYDPDSFLAMMKPMLETSRNKPLFLAIHFCLPHSPYYWGNKMSTDNVQLNYQSAVYRVDQQFHDFMQILQNSQLLKHAIVILLSDHGEAIEFPYDRVTSPDLFIAGAANPKKIIPKFYPPTLKDEPVDRSAGHGTDVLGLSQYHTVLAFRLFGLGLHQSTAVVAGRVSLLDIKPTVLSFLKQKVVETSLKNILLGKKISVVQNTDFFMETDFSPEAIRSAHPETRDVLFEGINYFQIDPVTLRLTVKNSMEKLIISSKQYADMYGEWILALYPQAHSTMMPILVNLKTGQWTNDLNTRFAMQSPAAHMLQALKAFYGKEITSQALQEAV